MAFKSGKSLGFISSLMIVIIPALFVPTFLAFFFGGAFVGATVGPVPLLVVFYFVVGVLGFLSFVLFLVAMHRLSESYHKLGIFNNALYGFITNLIGGLVAVVLDLVFFAEIVDNMRTRVPASVPSLGPLFLVVFGFALVIFVFSVIGAVFYMRAFNTLGDKSGVESFKTAGLLTLIGYVLTIVGVGVILVWIAWIFAVAGFHSLKEPSPPSYPSTAASVPADAMPQRRYCSYCGSENLPTSEFCTHCGRHL